MKLVKGEGRATRARALARLAAPGRAGPWAWAWAWRVVSCRVVTRRDETRRDRDRDRDRDAYALFCHSCRSFMSAIILCIKTTVTGN